MKVMKIVYALAGCVAIAALTGTSVMSTGYAPVFMERAELERSVFFDPAPRAMANPGKIYYREPFIYVVERYKGVHLIDNSVPATPRDKGFIVAPGCMDVAVKGDVMFLDNAVDLVAFDLEAKRVTKRVKEVFPEPAAPDGVNRYVATPGGMVLVGWKSVNL
jgi:hypothetical protein